MLRRHSWLALSLLVLGVGTGCARPEPVAVRAEPAPITMVRRGTEVFERHCNACHPGGKRGLGPALGRPIQRGLVIFQIRRGNGLMPPFDEETIDDRDLQALMTHLERIKEERQDAALAMGLVDTLGRVRPPIEDPATLYPYADILRVVAW